MTVRIVSNLDVQTQPGCGYCGDPNKTPTVLVIGEPRPDFITVVDSTGCRCCRDCGKHAFWLAMQERDPRRPMVQVVPIKAVAA